MSSCIFGMSMEEGKSVVVSYSTILLMFLCMDFYKNDFLSIRKENDDTMIPTCTYLSMTQVKW